MRRFAPAREGTAPKAQGQNRARILADFVGTWRLMRRITHAAAPSGVFEGQAVWQRQAGGLRYEESGLLTISDTAPVQAVRHYFWGPDLSVFFEDGRFFHQVPAHGGEVRHWCAPDAYEGVYDFSNWPRFSVTWQVRGPRKDYKMISDYSPPVGG